MAEEKRFQMERGSIGGSYFMVQLPDGSMERRMKMPINIDPGVHSSFNLDQLVPGTPITPVPTVPTLPTISEVKAGNNSDVNDSEPAGRAPALPTIAEVKARLTNALPSLTLTHNTHNIMHSLSLSLTL